MPYRIKKRAGQRLYAVQAFADRHWNVITIKKIHTIRHDEDHPARFKTLLQAEVFLTKYMEAQKHPGVEVCLANSYTGGDYELKFFIPGTTLDSFSTIFAALELKKEFDSSYCKVYEE